MKTVPLLVVYFNILSVSLSLSWGSSEICFYVTDPVTGLTKEQIRLVQYTWSFIRQDPLGSGEAVMLEYLRRYPHYQRMFTSVRNVPYPRLATNPAFQKVCLAVINSLSSMIDSLDKPDVLENILLRLGEGHKRLGVTKRQYIELKDTIMDVLAKALGQQWTPAVRAAWDATLDKINSVIFSTYN